MAGRRDGVKVAKERVMEVLDTRVIIQFFNNAVCMYVCVNRVSVEPELTSHEFYFVFCVFTQVHSPSTLTLFLCIFLFSLCIVRNSPKTYSCIPKRIKMTVKYKYKIYIQAEHRIRGFSNRGPKIIWKIKEINGS